MADEYDQRTAIALMATELGDGTTPRQFTFNGTKYDCAAGETDDQKALDEGGFTPDANLQLVVDFSKLPATPPGEQDLITYESRGLRIVGVQKSPDAAFLVLDCVDDSRGA